MRTDRRLRYFGVRATPVRHLLYDALESATSAMSLLDLEAELVTVDKSTIFRNLQLFLEVGLVHQIQDGSGVAKYAINQEHSHAHAHFTCEVCAETICLDDLSLSPDALAMPEGFEAQGCTVLIKGICPHCKRRRK